MSSKFVAWFKNLGKVDALDSTKNYFHERDVKACIPESFDKEFKMKLEIDHLKSENKVLKLRANHFKQSLILFSSERKSVTRDDFNSQLESLLKAQEAMTFHSSVSHQNPLTTALLQQNLYEAISKMWFVAFESPSLTEEEAEARYQKYLSETTVLEDAPSEEQK